MSVIAMFCGCEGAHSPDCLLGKRLKIKYSAAIQKLWDEKGPEVAEAEVDRLMALKK